MMMMIDEDNIYIEVNDQLCLKRPIGRVDSVTCK